MDWFVLREPVSAWTHALWCVLALPATFLLLRRGRGDRVRQLGLLVFGLGLFVCYAGSALYHGVRLPPEQIALFATLDYIGIFVLIAASITPVAVIVLRGRWRWGMLLFAWSVACAGIGARLTLGSLALPLSTLIYVSMGWGVLACYFELARILSHRALRMALLGGLFYTLGGLLNVLRWPVVVPGVVGPHEVFHLFVMAGSFCHFWFILTVVARYSRSAPLPAPAGLPLAAPVPLEQPDTPAA